MSSLGTIPPERYNTIWRAAGISPALECGQACGWIREDGPCFVLAQSAHSHDDCSNHKEERGNSEFPFEGRVGSRRTCSENGSSTASKGHGDELPCSSLCAHDHESHRLWEFLYEKRIHLIMSCDRIALGHNCECADRTGSARRRRISGRMVPRIYSQYTRAVSKSACSACQCRSLDRLSHSHPRTRRSDGICRRRLLAPSNRVNDLVVRNLRFDRKGASQ